MEQLKEKKHRLTGKLNQAVMWAVITEIGFGALVVLFFAFKKDFWWILLIGFGIYTILFIYIITALRKGILRELVHFSADYSDTQHTMLYRMDIPYAVLDKKGGVLWMNKRMEAMTTETEVYRKNIAGLFPRITPNNFPKGDEEVVVIRFDHDVAGKTRQIKAEVRGVESREGIFFYGVYLFDETSEEEMRKKLIDDSFAVALIDIDNYEDVLDTADDFSQSYITGIIDRKVRDYFTGNGAFIKKLEKDRYLSVFRHEDLERFKSDRFSVLEDIKAIEAGNQNSVTLSIGVGTGDNDYGKCYEVSKSSLELALGRGGDQVVLRDGEEVSYFGGKSQHIESNTRVKARVKAHALRKVIESKDRVIIMGHKYADIDAFGSAIGMYCFARDLDKEAFVVLNEISPSVKPFYDRFMSREEYEDAFIKSNTAISKADADTVVIVTDVNRPEMTECPEILSMVNTRVVFDHHRITENPIKNVVLSHVDTTASSSSEMVTEIMQFGSMDIKLKGFEADALYAGIVIDTDQFNTKAGPRTFEAAAFLRRNGADVLRVRKLLRTDMDEYRAVAYAVGHAEIFKQYFAITDYYDATGGNPIEGAAKAANDLLDIAGVKASFALCELGNQVRISARSIDEVNVQLIMEKLGGGGHLGTAGAQIEDSTIEEVVQRLKDTISEMLEKGEI